MSMHNKEPTTDKADDCTIVSHWHFPKRKTIVADASSSLHDICGSFY